MLAATIGTLHEHGVCDLCVIEEIKLALIRCFWLCSMGDDAAHSSALVIDD